MFIPFKERAWGGERERDIKVRNIDWLPPIRILTRDRTCNLDMSQDRESNRLYLLVYRMMLQPTEPLARATYTCFLCAYENVFLEVELLGKYVLNVF